MTEKDKRIWTALMTIVDGVRWHADSDALEAAIATIAKEIGAEHLNVHIDSSELELRRTVM